MFGFAKGKKEMPLSVVMYFRALENNEVRHESSRIITMAAGYAEALRCNSIVTVALAVIVSAVVFTANILNA